MKAIANSGQKILTPTKCSLRKFQRRRAFISPLPIDNSNMLKKKLTTPLGAVSKFVVCAFVIFHDVKFKP
jgi:hypothetical protein